MSVILSCSKRIQTFVGFGQDRLLVLLGDWFNLIASAILIANLTKSKFALGVLFTIRMLAPFFVAPLAGVCADRFNRKSILIVTDIVRGLLLFGFLFIRDKNDVWLLYVLTTLLFGVSGFFSPARSAILPDVTSQRELGTANALSATTWSVMLAFGAAIGGFTTGLFGVHTAFIIDGFTFFRFLLDFCYRLNYRTVLPHKRMFGKVQNGQHSDICFGIPIFSSSHYIKLL